MRTDIKFILNQASFLTFCAFEGDDSDAFMAFLPAAKRHGQVVPFLVGMFIQNFKTFSFCDLLHLRYLPGFRD